MVKLLHVFEFKREKLVLFRSYADLLVLKDPVKRTSDPCHSTREDPPSSPGFWPVGEFFREEHDRKGSG